LWDVETAKELKKLTGHRGKANALAFSPDGKTLISAGDDTTVLFWNIAAISGRKRQEQVLAAKDWDELWEDLAGADGIKAHQAVARLTASPQTTISALKEQLRPAPAVEAARVGRLIRDLDADDFAVRQKAAEELERLGEAVQPALEEERERPGASAELRRQTDSLLEALRTPAGNRVRELRSLEVLEHIGTAEAKRVLQNLAQGAAESRLTQEAKAALRRMSP
jgi:hypothetical protein